MVNGIRTIYCCGLDKGFSSKFCVGSQVWQETSKEGQRMHQPKHCEYENKDEDNSLNTLNDENFDKNTMFTIPHHEGSWNDMAAAAQRYT